MAHKLTKLRVTFQSKTLAKPCVPFIVECVGLRKGHYPNYMVNFMYFLTFWSVFSTTWSVY